MSYFHTCFRDIDFRDNVFPFRGGQAGPEIMIMDFLFFGDVKLVEPSLKESLPDS